MDPEKCKCCGISLRDVRIRCHSCENLSICLQCFMLGGEIEAHLKHHGYTVEEAAATPLFTAASSSRGKERHPSGPAKSSSSQGKERHPSEPAKSSSSHQGVPRQLWAAAAEGTGPGGQGPSRSAEGDNSSTEGPSEQGGSGSSGRDEENAGQLDRKALWPARDELALMEGVEQYGFGNWEAFARANVDQGCSLARFTSDELRAHYEECYLSGRLADATKALACPWKTRSKAAGSAVSSSAPSAPLGVSVGGAPTTGGGEGSSRTRPLFVRDHTAREEGAPLSPSLTAPLAPCYLNPTEARLLGFLPQRDDFEREFDNEAERALAAVELGHEDEEVDTLFKLFITSTYRVRLRDRARVKGVSRGHNLIGEFIASFKKGHPGAKKRSVRELRAWKERTRRLTQLTGRTKLSTMFEYLQRATEVRSNVKQLAKYRRHGLTKLSEVDRLEKEQSKRERAKEAKKRPVVTPALEGLVTGGRHPPSGYGSTPSSPVSRNSRLENGAAHPSAQRLEGTSSSRRNGPPTAPLAGLQAGLCGLPQAPARPSTGGLTGAEAAPSTRLGMGTGGSYGPARAVTQHYREKLNGSLSPLRPVLRQSTQNTSRVLLSANEKKLIRSIGMPSANYLMLKISIIKDYARRKEGASAKPRFPSGFDKTHRRKILNFLQESGWIPST